MPQRASGSPAPSDADIAKRLVVLDKIYVDLSAVHDDEQARAVVKADVAQAVADKVSFLLPPGALEEYGEIEETVAPAALKQIGDWVVAQSR